MPLLAWALTGDSQNIDIVEPLVKLAHLKGYTRFSLIGRDYPGVLKHDENSTVDGLLFFPQNKSQRKKLDNFEGDEYAVAQLQVTVVGEEDRVIDADVYLFNGDSDDILAGPWDLDWFIRERLEDWVELFAGMRLIGDEIDP